MTITKDLLLGQQLCVFQPKTGFRAGTDSVLLGAAVSRVKTGAAAEFGCGAGAALFVAGHHLPDMTFIGFEKDPDMAALARRGVEANGYSGRLSIETQDVAKIDPDMENRFALCFSNPPYFEAERTKPPAETREAAYLESLGLDEWLKRMLFVTAPKGQVVLIHRAAELARILPRLDRQGGEIDVLPIRPYPGAPASRVLVRARKGLRSGPVRLLAGLDLHQASGAALTARADAILTGSPLEWA